MYKRRKSNNVKKEVLDSSETPYSDEEAGMYIKNMNSKRIAKINQGYLRFTIIKFKTQTI